MMIVGGWLVPEIVWLIPVFTTARDEIRQRAQPLTSPVHQEASVTKA
jgi:hypothetical protein